MVVACRVCKSTTEEFFVGSTALLRCTACDATYLRSMPDHDALREHYENSYVVSTDDFAATEIRRITTLPEQLRLVSVLNRYLPPPANVLDIGCDKGYFLDEARRYGYHCAGIEPSLVARAYCEAIGLTIYPDLSSLAPNERFDAIVMWHSLEHFTDPLGTLQKINTLLSPGGMLFIRVPDFNSFWRKLFGERWIWFQPHNHYFQFTPSSLRFVIEASGFEILSIRSQRPSTLLTLRAFRTGRKAIKRSFGISTSFRKRLGRLYEYITGIELFAIAKKK